KAFAPGSYGFELWPGLDVLPGDLKVPKNRFGAFVAGQSTLHPELQARNIDTVIITGTATNVCCESTARDAMMMNYKTIFAADGTATFNDEKHTATLGTRPRDIERRGAQRDARHHAGDVRRRDDDRRDRAAAVAEPEPGRGIAH